MLTKKHIMLISQQFFLHLHVCPTWIVLHQEIFSRSLLLTSRWPESNHDTFVGICVWDLLISPGTKIQLTHPPLVPHICQWTRSALVQGMACRLFSAKSLPALLLTGHLGTNFNEILIKSKRFHSLKCTSKYRLRNGRHFVQGEMR